MKLLAIDTSAALCSAALLDDDQLTQRSQLAPRRHAELILPMMDELLHEAGLVLAELDALAYGHGPGSFTGVRIAAAVTQGAAFGADLPVIGISTLAGLAQGVWRRQRAPRVLCALDARMGEVYWGAYAADDLGLMRGFGRDRVTAPTQVRLPDGGSWVGAGSGWAAYADLLGDAVGTMPRAPQMHCDAHDIAVLAADAYKEGSTCAAQDALPVYLRDRVAEPPRR
jgi:tRNA threonylcarbamoyladenosine biosynthesis protein TsaB